MPRTQRFPNRTHARCSRAKPAQAHPRDAAVRVHIHGACKKNALAREIRRIHRPPRGQLFVASRQGAMNEGKSCSPAHAMIR